MLDPFRTHLTRIRQLARRLRPPQVAGTPVHTRSIWVLGRARWLLGIVLTVLGTAGTLLGAPDLTNQLRAQLPGVRCWFPVPMDDARFTVAMSPFVTVDGDGRAATRQDGRELARLLFTRLEHDFGALGLDVPYELRGPDPACPIEGATPEARAAAAATWAADIGADVVIYGAILTGDDGVTQLQPEFYVAYRGFDAAAELVGPHELGRPVAVSLPVSARDLEGVGEHPVNGRAKALSLVALGLASFGLDHYDQALDYFSAAAQAPGWPADGGQELVYLLMGNAASNLAAVTLDSAYVDEALDYYDQALALEPDFARALVGSAAATYQQALGDLAERRADGVDLTRLDEAAALYRLALAAEAPAEAEVPLKVHFGLGQIYLVRAYLEQGDWLDQARREFQILVDAHAAGTVRNTPLVGHAYARLGLISLQFDQDLQAAQHAYSEAVRLVTPRWQAQYELDLGDVYVRLAQPDLARTHFEQARAVAELHGNRALASKASQRLTDLP
jgi:tetratricopeptide (TPR) repeat protein